MLGVEKAKVGLLAEETVEGGRTCEFYFGQVTFEKLIKHPNGLVEWAVK